MFGFLVLGTFVVALVAGCFYAWKAGAHIPLQDTFRNVKRPPPARPASTLGEMFLCRADISGDSLCYAEKTEASSEWIPVSWHEVVHRAMCVATCLARFGVEPGDTVAILGPTRGTWVVLDVACHLCGAISLGVYPRQSPDMLRYIFSDSSTKVIFVTGEMETVVEAAVGVSSLVAIVPWTEEEMITTGSCVQITPLSRLLHEQPMSRAECMRRMASRTNQCAILVYTSGTTGPPKGCMITHRNILSVLECVADHELMDIQEGDRAICFLPMAHVAERIIVNYGRWFLGCPGYYATRFNTILQELVEVKPTVYGGVPRIFEKAYIQIHSEAKRKGPRVLSMLTWAERVGREKIRRWQRGESIPIWLALKCFVADLLVFRKIRAVFGGKTRLLFTGAAPLSREILEFFWASGLCILEMYGLTEVTCITHANLPRGNGVRFGTVGRPLPRCECRVVEDGEVYLKTPWIFEGYLNHPQETAKMIDKDGWLHTGDIGTIDAQGFLRITDRKKHIIITSGGKNITPSLVEAALKAEDPLISYVHSHGDRRPYLSAIIAPSPVETLEFGANKGLISQSEYHERTREISRDPSARSEALDRAMARIVEHPEFKARICRAVKRGNAKVGHVEEVRRFMILGRDFSQERGELTPTMKLKRKMVENQFASVFDRIYSEDGFAIAVV